ncbi:MAG: diaminopropionate ammonia-lyase [Chromatocurvus sp.]
MSSPLYIAGGSLLPLSVDERDLYLDEAGNVSACLRQCPAYCTTPLLEMPATSVAQLGIRTLWVKDESERFGIDSFKALGGAYAVIRIAAQRIGVDLDSLTDLEALKRCGAGLVICAATDGNHGRAVAVGARLIGARCIIFVHEHVAESRRSLLRAAGAELRIIEGHYDDAVEACRSAAKREGWQLVADVALAGEDTTVARSVAHGYLTIADEFQRQLQGAIPTHVFLQAGVGGLAAAMVASMASFGWKDTRVIIVEPSAAACLRVAAELGSPTRLKGDIDSVMGMLSCGEASAAAWPILKDRVFGYLTLAETAALPAARWLEQHCDARHLQVGLSGAAGLAGLLMTTGDTDIRARLGLDQDARVLVIATERDVDGLLAHAEAEL